MKKVGQLGVTVALNDELNRIMFVTEHDIERGLDIKLDMLGYDIFELELDSMNETVLSYDELDIVYSYNDNINIVITITDNDIVGNLKDDSDDIASYIMNNLDGVELRYYNK